MLNLIEDVVRSHMHNGETFTAYDISKEVQKQGNFVRHINIKSSIHNECENLMNEY